MNLGKDMPILARFVDLASTMLLVIAISAIIGLILAWPVQLLWNFVFGELYRINFLQAWALNVLAGILFGKAGNGKK
ncbi:hypothetical protein J4419_00570 [Candidatus Woesearchaeota archaeon]|nr:hypothetical protein [Candidatus Woesearchaeota archaeon]